MLQKRICSGEKNLLMFKPQALANASAINFKGNVIDFPSGWMPFCTDPGSFPRREESGQVTVLTQTCSPQRRVKLRRESTGGRGSRAAATWPRRPRRSRSRDSPSHQLMAPAADWPAACTWAGRCWAGGVSHSPAPAPAGSVAAAYWAALARQVGSVCRQLDTHEWKDLRTIARDPQLPDAGTASSAQVWPSPLEAQVAWGGGRVDTLGRGACDVDGAIEGQGRTPTRESWVATRAGGCLLWIPHPGRGGKRWCVALRPASDLTVTAT